MQMTAVASSQVSAVGYDPAAQDLAVQFTSGGTYTYHGVPAETFSDLMESASIGRAIGQLIKPVFGSTRPDGTHCPATVPKAAKVEAPKAVTVAVVPVAPPVKATSALPETEVYTWEQLCADLRGTGAGLLAGAPVTITDLDGLTRLGEELQACGDELAALDLEYSRKKDVVLSREYALRRYFEPQAKRVTEQIVAALGGARKSIDTTLADGGGKFRWGLTTQPARLQLDDPDAATAWAKANLPGAVLAIPERVIPACEQLASGLVVEAWKANPGTVPAGFVLVPEIQKFSYKLVPAKEA